MVKLRFDLNPRHKVGTKLKDKIHYLVSQIVPHQDFVMSRNGGYVTLDFNVPITQTQKDDIILAISHWRSFGAEKHVPEKLYTLSPSQLRDYIDNNVTDLLSAKAVLKKMALLILYLYQEKDAMFIGESE